MERPGRIVVFAATTALCLFGDPRSCTAQAPMVTDDAAVALRRTLHVEIFNQTAWLPRSQRPDRLQNTLVMTVGYGASSRLEVGFDIPLISIESAAPDITGFGDLNLTAKYVFRSPQNGRTGWAWSGAVEIPTGDENRGLGSGVLDYGVNAIAEHPFTNTTVLRVNTGIQFAGNTLTGVVGIRDRGTVLSAGSSVTHALKPNLQMGAELTGYQGRSPDSRDRELRLQVAGTYSLSSRTAVSVAVQRGWFATPPVTVQVGVAFDP